MRDERLARRAAAGDSAAFEAIFRRYHQDLYRFCLATVGNPEDAQDAVQNTMVKALRALPGERREVKLKPWLYRVARNEAVETIRKRRDGAELEPDQPATGLEVAETAAARERLRRLFTDLEELPERQRSALVMRELSGLDFEEIGAAFGTSPAVARQTLYEARLSLRQMEEGREMSCETVMRALSGADGRVTRRRDLRAHLRGCASCRAFRDGIQERRGELAAIAPLPAVVAAGLLESLLGAQAGLGGAGAGAAAGGTAAGAGGGGAAGVAGVAGVGGKVVATSVLAKSAATVAVAAVVGASAADRGGVIDLPLPGRSSESTSDNSTPGAPTGGSVAEGSGESSGSQSKVGSGQAPKEGKEPAQQNAASKEATSARHPARPGGERAKGKQNRQSHAKPATGQSNGRGNDKSHGQEKASQGRAPASNPGKRTAGANRSPQAGGSPSRDRATGKPTPSPRPIEASKGKGAPVTAPTPTPAVPESVESAKGKSGSHGAAAGRIELPEP